MFYRTLLGSLFLLLLLLLKGERLRPDAPPRQTAAAALSCVSMGLSWIFLYEAYQRIGVGLSSVAYYCGPVIVLLAAPLVFRKRLTAAQTACFGVVFAGILLISAPDLSAGSGVDGPGLLCGFASALLHALMVIFTMKAPEVTGMKNAALQLTVSFFTVAAFTGLLTPPQGGEQRLWMLVLGLVNTGLGCYLHFSDIARLPVVTVSILGYLEPMSAVFFAVLLLHERLSALELAGALLILAGAAVTERLRAE
ncbi:DMT family transporter [uncultured Oscillibacter sp.]|uniref:DMT family transporter n=1 Tax=uncultured Oscillibacter sp. TaxID=876091 RepID=UPI0025E266BB|nr:DMT family transporter [uncultured Oscillibacter sp.]